ncbi:MAG TPA: hypothetical protein VND21_07965 [Planctomycetota bacterium]|nr:hypothetical protein [Planctomycetota bacterium]
MTLRSLPLVAGALLVAAVAARAADPKTYKVRFDDVWTVGAVVTRESRETESTEVVVRDADKVVEEQKGSVTTVVRLVEKCLAAEEGKATRRLVYFASWKVAGEGSQGALKDDSLTGTHVEVSGQGPARAWKVLTPGKEVSDIAKAWLGKKYTGPAAEDARALLASKDAVAPGASWSPDIDLLVKQFGAAMDADPAESSVKVTFVEVQPGETGEFGKFAMEMDLATRSLQGRKGRIPWQDGGRLKQKGVLVRNLADGAFDEERAIETSLAGTANGGESVRISFKHKSSLQEAAGVGGEMPAGPVSTSPSPVLPPDKPSK